MHRVLHGQRPFRDHAHTPLVAQFSYGFDQFVLRRAMPVGLSVVALLLLLGVPFLGVKWGFTQAARLFLDRRRRGRWPTCWTTISPTDWRPRCPWSSPTDAHGVSPGELQRYAAELSRVPDVSAVTAPTGTFMAGNRVGPPAAATGMANGSALLLPVGQHCAAVLAGLEHPARSTASSRRALGTVGGDGRTGADQPRQRRCDHQPTAAGVRADRADHLHAAVLAHRQRGAARCRLWCATCCR